MQETITFLQLWGQLYPITQFLLFFYPGSILNPLLFILVLEALTREFRTGLPWELLYADDLVLMADSIEELEILFERWKSGMEQKGLTS